MPRQLLLNNLSRSLSLSLLARPGFPLTRLISVYHFVATFSLQMRAVGERKNGSVNTSAKIPLSDLHAKHSPELIRVANIDPTVAVANWTTDAGSGLNRKKR